MGHKISPTSFRIGIQKDWLSRWFGQRKYISLLKDDVAVRAFLEKKMKNMSVDRVEIERGTDLLNIIIFSSRPGLLIGRGGTGIDELKTAIRKVLKKKVGVRIEIQEIKNPESSAAIMAESIADQIEKRLPFRRIMKQTLAKIIASKQAKGAKIQLSGRLDGAEIACRYKL
ncbi:MAG: 30S ribosomal protein S3 [Candidatus Yanofskybacteria bacterium GW2011_GWF2_43_596]|nr:MAG: 30S ribosomal protein S3 [Candidatus Yanofskybacteria bacterium GW2011_GWF2_43_596]